MLRFTAILYQLQLFVLLMAYQIPYNSYMPKDKVCYDGVWRLQQRHLPNWASFTMLTIIQQFQVVSSYKNTFCIILMKDRKHYLTYKYRYNLLQIYIVRC